MNKTTTIRAKFILRLNLLAALLLSQPYFFTAQESFRLEEVLSDPIFNQFNELEFTKELIGTMEWEEHVNVQKIPQKSAPIQAKKMNGKLSFGSDIEPFPKKQPLGVPKLSERDLFQITESTSLNFKYLDSRNGLLTDEILAVAFDSSNSAWAISSTRLLKLNGIYVREYGFEQGLPDMRPTDILTHKNTVVISTWGQGLLILKGDSLIELNKDVNFPTNHIRSIKKLGDFAFFSDSKGRLYRINLVSFQTQKVLINGKQASATSLHTTENSLSFINDQGVLCSLDKEFVCYRLLGYDAIQSHFKFNEKTYSLTKGEELVYGEKEKFYVLSSSLLKNIQYIFPAKSGSVWVITKDHVLLIKEDKIQNVFKTNFKLGNMKITDIVQDEMSNLWVTSSNAGLGLITPSFFSVVEFGKDLIDKESDFLYVDKQGNVFSEHKDGGLVKKGKDGRIFTLKSPEMKNLTSGVSFQGNLFFSAIGGLYQLTSDSIISFQLLPDQGLNSHLRLRVHQGDIYINNYNYGVIRFTGSQFFKLVNTSTLTTDSYSDQEGQLWVANDDKGISIISDNSIRFINQSTGFKVNRVNAISGNLKGILLLATNRGLFLLHNEQITELLHDEPGSKDFRNSIYLREKDEFWTSNETNIYSIVLQDGKPVIQKYSRNNFTSIGQIKKNSFIGNQAQFYFKTGESIINYFWYSFDYLNVEPEIRIKWVDVRNDQYSNAELLERNTIQFDRLDAESVPVNLSLKPGNYNLSFIYDVNLWGSEDKLSFYYRLKGLSDSWIGPVSKRTIEYTNLAYGNYELEIKTYLDGEVDIKNLNYPFVIKKHFYQEFYFLFLVVLAILLSTVILIKTFTKLSFSSLDSYTSLSVMINKMRVFSILAFIVIPAIAFYESEILELYTANWFLVSVICLASLVTLISSFYRKQTAKSISIFLGALYFIIVFTIFHIAFEQNLNATLVAESSIILLFSRLVFRKFKYLTASFIAVFAFLILETIYWSPDQLGISILISTTILFTVVVICIILVEGNSVNSLAFANKILKSSNLFVLVADLSGKIVFVSKPLLEVTGKSESDLLGEGWWEYRGDNVADKFDVSSTIEEALKNSKAPKYINQLNTKDGVCDIEWSDFSLEDKFVISIGKDITNELRYQKETEMLSLVATSVTNGVLITDGNNKALWFNNQLRELVGVESSKIIGTDIIKLIRPYIAETGKVIKDASVVKENKTQTIHIKAKSKMDEKYILLTNSLVYQKDGSVEKKIFVWTDISDQYLLEKRYKDIINNAFDSIYTANYKGEFTYVNKSMENKLKMTSEELIGRSFIEIIHPSDRQETEEFYQRQFNNLQLYSYYEFRVVGSNTGELWVGQSVRLVVDPKNKRKVVEMHAVARDITESKKNREELTRLSYVASNTENIVIILDKGFDIVWVNQAFTQVFGYKLEEVLGKNPGDFLNGRNTNQQTIGLITEKLVNREHVSVELVNYDKYGNEKWIQISMDPIFDENGKLINYIAVEEDITERKSQQLLIQEQHDSIIDSLNYSSIIQEASLPSLKEVMKINPETFVYHRPKEIIGGDFYVVDTVRNDKGDQLEVYIVADCTGHGVPGAMLSVLCTGLLKEAIIREDVHNPAQALNHTRKRLIEVFSDSEKHTINDGMDVCFLVVNRSKKTFDYSGANRPLYMVRGDKVEVLKGDKQSVGFNYSHRSFTHETLDFEDGDLLYLFSDGIIDQFGGERNKKFLSSRFKKTLVAIRELPMEQQKAEIDRELLEWQGTGEQTDDICLMGVKL